MIRSRLPFLAVPLAVLAATACDTTATTCDERAVASVSLSFVDLEGNPVSPTEATYRVDGGEELPVECTNEDCTEAVAGWEQAGTFEITVVYHEPVEGEPDCWYTDQVTETVEVAQGECHVEGVQLTIELDTTFVDCLMGTQTGT